MNLLSEAGQSLSRRILATRRRLKIIDGKIDLQTAYLQSILARLGPQAAAEPPVTQGRWRLADYKGFRLLLDSEGLVDQYLLGPGNWEHEQIDFLFFPLKNGKVSGECVFLDIGAYCGLYAFEALSHSHFSKVYAFEANPINFAQLTANWLINGGGNGRLHIQHRVVTDKPGFSHSVSPRENNRGMARVIPSADDDGIAHAVLDELFHDHSCIYFCKIDVEGHELSVLEGMKKLLRAARCFLQIEILQGNRERVMFWMREAGYRKIHEIGEDFYFTNIPSL
jgi:FkbM family methyltransferase